MRTRATNFFTARQVLAELDALKFAVSSLATIAGQPGSFERENGKNIEQGIRTRIDYLHDSIALLLPLTESETKTTNNGESK